MNLFKSILQAVIPSRTIEILNTPEGQEKLQKANPELARKYTPLSQLTPKEVSQPQQVVQPVQFTVPNIPIHPEPPKSLQDIINQVSQKHDVNPSLLSGFIFDESSYRSLNQPNKAGAVGIAQFTPITVDQVRQQYNKNFDPKDINQSIDAMAWYMKWLQEQTGVSTYDELRKAYIYGAEGYKAKFGKGTGKMIPPVQIPTGPTTPVSELPQNLPTGKKSVGSAILQGLAAPFEAGERIVGSMATQLGKKMGGEDISWKDVISPPKEVIEQQKPFYETLRQMGIPVAVAFVASMAAGPPMGKAEKAVGGIFKRIAKSNSIDEIGDLIRKNIKEVPESKVASISQRLQNVSNPKIVEDILDVKSGPKIKLESKATGGGMYYNEKATGMGYDSVINISKDKMTPDTLIHEVSHHEFMNFTPEIEKHFGEILNKVFPKQQLADFYKKWFWRGAKMHSSHYDDIINSKFSDFSIGRNGKDGGFYSNIPNEIFALSMEKYPNLENSRLLKEYFTDNNLRKQYISEFNKFVEEHKIIDKVNDSIKNSEIIAKTNKSEIEKLVSNSLNKLKPTEETSKFEGFTEFSSKFIEKLKGKTEMPKTSLKQFIAEIANKEGLKKAEKDVLNMVVDGFNSNNVPIKKFAEEVINNFIPLTTKLRRNMLIPQGFTRVYESPIAIFAGQRHFDRGIKKYFGHISIFDENKSRYVNELQTDLYQKRGLEIHLQAYLGKEKKTKIYPIGETSVSPALHKIDDILTFGKKYVKMNPITAAKEIILKYKLDTRFIPAIEKEIRAGENDIYTEMLKYLPEPKPDELKNYLKEIKRIQQLKQYNTETSSFRIIREEIKKAVKERKTEILFPADKTIFALEGMESTYWKAPVIYKFYNNTIGEYLKKQYGAQKVRRKFDSGSIFSWWKVDLKPEMAEQPVLAHAIAPYIVLQKKKEKQKNESR